MAKTTLKVKWISFVPVFCILICVYHYQASLSLWLMQETHFFHNFKTPLQTVAEKLEGNGNLVAENNDFRCAISRTYICPHSVVLFVVFNHLLSSQRQKKYKDTKTSRNTWTLHNFSFFHKICRWLTILSIRFVVTPMIAIPLLGTLLLYVTTMTCCVCVFVIFVVIFHVISATVILIQNTAITTPNGSEQDRSTKTQTAQGESSTSPPTNQQSKRQSTRRKSCSPGEDNSGNPPPEKQSKNTYIHDGKACGPCTVWIKTEKKKEYLLFHSSQPMKHPNDKYVVYSEYLSAGGTDIQLSPDSCICGACYADAYKNSKKQDQTPRWMKLHIPKKSGGKPLSTLSS